MKETTTPFESNLVLDAIIEAGPRVTIHPYDQDQDMPAPHAVLDMQCSHLRGSQKAHKLPLCCLYSVFLRAKGLKRRTHQAFQFATSPLPVF